jgi:hypothetical protein
VPHFILLKVNKSKNEIRKILDKLGSLEKLFCKIIDTITSKSSTIKELKNNLILQFLR